MSDLYLNIGCGRHLLDGFVNIDVEEGVDLHHDVTEGLPYDDGAVDGIFNEHFLEHLTQGQGVEFLRECRRVLRPGAILRVAMPDLDTPVNRYMSEDWRGDSDMYKYGYGWVDNRCEMLNISMREWGHQWVYNEEELARLAQLAGLEVLGRRRRGEGADPRLVGLEHRDNSRLIMEFRPFHRPIAAGDHPLVSVLIPAYKPAFFQDALDSALTQTYPNIEVIVCDDCPDDAIEKIVAATPDPRVHYVHNEQRLGGRYNYVKCLSLAKGEFIKYLNDDDRLHPDCIARLVDCFRRFPRLRLATSRRKLIDQHGRVVPDQHFNRPLGHTDSLIEGRALARQMLSTIVNMVGEPSTALFRREDALQIRPHPFSFGGEEAPGVGDVALWLNLLSRGNCVYLLEPLSHFRIHDNQHQLASDIAETTPHSWMRLRYHAQRLGLWQPDLSFTLQAWPLAPNGELASPPDAAPRDRHTHDFWSGGPLYEKWLALTEPTEADHRLLQERMATEWRYNPSFHLITVCRTDQEASVTATLASLQAQLYPAWGLTVLATVDAPAGLFDDTPNVEWITVGDGDLVSAANQALAETGADWAALIEPGDRLPGHALASFADYVNLHPEWRAVYSDADIVDPDGRRDDPRFHPDFNLEMLRSTPYFGNACLLHRQTLAELGGLRALPGAEVYDAVLRLVETHGERAVGHVHDVLFHQGHAGLDRYRQPVVYEAARTAVAEHLQRSGLRARVSPGVLPGTHFIEYLHDVRPMVSVIIPTKDRLDLLRPCVESLLSKTSYPNYEVLVVDNNSTDPATLAYLETLSSRDDRVRVLRYPQAYNFSAINNYAARQARGEYLLLLNNDTHIVQDVWLERMLAHGQRSEVAIVGARLVYTDQTLQHAGVILGMGAADHMHIGIPMDDPGYLGRAQVAQNFSVVTAACLLIRRSVYEEVAGLDDQQFKVLFNDVDLCLKVVRHGYKVVWTPFATLVHHGSSSINNKKKREEMQKIPEEAWSMFGKWLPWIAGDPAFNRNLSLLHRDVRVEGQAVAGWNTDFHPRPRVIGFPGDTTGAGRWRVQAPLNALRAAAKVQVLLMPGGDTRRLLELSEVARMAPDALLIQSPLDKYHISILEIYRRFLPNTRLILELGDLDTGRAPGDGRAEEAYGVLDSHLHAALPLCDRLIVATDDAREAYRRYIDDIVVVPDYLQRQPWEGLRSQRGRSAKPRVGWSGSWQDHADLQVLRDVVEATANEVEWVFFGASLPALRPYAHEVLEAVDAARYPGALAALDLDLAVTPWGPGFNPRDVYRRTLEFGILGVPVLCSEAAAGPLGDAPVGITNDTPEDWIEAIRTLISDSGALARAGDALRDWVERHWVLENHLDEWLAAITAPATAPRLERAPPPNPGVAAPAANDAPACSGEEAVLRLVRPNIRLAAEEPAPAAQAAPAPSDAGSLPAESVEAVVCDDYAEWCDQNRLTEADAQLMAERMMRDWTQFPAVHLVAVVQPGQEPQLVETIADLGGQLYQGWGLTIFAAGPCPEPSLLQVDNIEWIEADGDVTERVNRAVSETGADWVALLEPGDRLEPHLLYACIDYVNRHPGCKLLYVDEDTIDAAGRRYDARFKPDFNLDLLLSTPYVGPFCLVNRHALEHAGGWVEREGLESYDAALRILEAAGEEAIGHVTEMLYHRREEHRRALLEPAAVEAGRQAVADHLARSGVPAEVSLGLIPGSYCVDYLHKGQPRVSVIIPTRDRAVQLATCVRHLTAKTAYPNYEILIVDNGSTADDAVACLRELEANGSNVKVLPVTGEYNVSAMRNEAARAATGEFLLFLDDDTVIIQERWLERMLAHARRPDVGVVGARLVLTDQGLEHAGLVLGMGSNGVAGKPFSGLPMQAPGVMGRAQVAQNYSAVSGACLLIRRALFNQVGGMDEERLAISYNDVDLCLKVREAGYRIVWTPFATIARVGTTRLQPLPGHGTEAARAELATILDRWLPQLAHDPAYHRRLSLMEPACTVETEIDISWDPQTQGPPRILGGGLGYGSLHYRVSEPLAALKRAARAQVAFIPGHQDRLRVPSVAELERAGPDVLLLHNSIHEIQLEILQWYRRFTNVFTVFGQDDLIFDVPDDHPMRSHGCKDAEARIRSALSRCDRLVVTTEALADAHRHMIDDIRVVPNYLDSRRWGHLRSERRTGVKPRVGWAGAQQHHGDLKLLIDVVKATAAEVDWVFFGMCPDELLALIKEFHGAVPYERYPDKLASLNLDIAVAPLAVNRFNECKSNLRLLEYGALGWPVICTDIVPYRGAPVQHVANTPRAWVDAIMDRARDLDAAAWEGDRLREWVRRHWMLDDHLDEWLAALLSGTERQRRHEPGATVERPGLAQGDTPQAGALSG